MPSTDGPDRRQRWHLSFSGVLVPATLIVVAALSLGSIMTGMHYVTITQSPQAVKRWNDAMLLPANSQSGGDDMSDDAAPLPIGDTYDSNDNQISEDISSGEDNAIPPTPSDDKEGSDEMSNENEMMAPNDKQSTDGQIDEVEANELPAESVSMGNEEQVSYDYDEGDAADGTPDPSRSDGAQIMEEKRGVDEEQSPSGDDISRGMDGDNGKSLSPSLIYPRVTSLEGASDAVFKQYLRGSSNDEERTIKISKKDLRQQERLKHSDDFSYRDPLYEGDCVPMQKWQETSFPICNMMHELDFYGKTRTREFEYITKGGYNQIFVINEKDKTYDPRLVMKILKWGTEYSDRNFDRVRRDGLILERLTKSPYVLDTYGFCGFDVLTPYAGGGTLSHKLREWGGGKLKLSPKRRLELAAQAASGLADVHDIDDEGMSSVSHGDLKGSQYIFMDGRMLLGDFNRGRFLRRNSTAPDTACTYTIGKNDAAFRSPEEYEYLPQTSAIDVYALGSILYQLLTGDEVWHDTDTDDAQRYIRKGKRPKIDEKILKSDDPVDVALREAIDMCYVFDPKKRAKAGAVASYLRKRLSELRESEPEG